MASLAVRLATDDDWEVRARALEVLRETGNKTKVGVAVRAIEDSEDVVVVEAIECIVEWRALQVADKVARLLDSSSELVRSYAAWALGKIGDRRHVKGLRQRFHVARDEIEGSALAEALFTLTRQRRYLTHLLTQLKSRDPEVRAFTSNSLVGVVDGRNFVEVLCSFAHALARERNVVVLQNLRRDIESALANALEATKQEGEAAKAQRRGGGRRRTRRGLAVA